MYLLTYVHTCIMHSGGFASSFAGSFCSNDEARSLYTQPYKTDRLHGRYLGTAGTSVKYNVLKGHL